MPAWFPKHPGGNGRGGPSSCAPSQSLYTLTLMDGAFPKGSTICTHALGETDEARVLEAAVNPTGGKLSRQPCRETGISDVEEERSLILTLASMHALHEVIFTCELLERWMSLSQTVLSQMWCPEKQ